MIICFQIRLKSTSQKKILQRELLCKPQDTCKYPANTSSAWNHRTGDRHLKEPSGQPDRWVSRSEGDPVSREEGRKQQRKIPKVLFSTSHTHASKNMLQKDSLAFVSLFVKTQLVVCYLRTVSGPNHKRRREGMKKRKMGRKGDEDQGAKEVKGNRLCLRARSYLGRSSFAFLSHLHLSLDGPPFW